MTLDEKKKLIADLLKKQKVLKSSLKRISKLPEPKKKTTLLRRQIKMLQIIFQLISLIVEIKIIVSIPENGILQKANQFAKDIDYNNWQIDGYKETLSKIAKRT